MDSKHERLTLEAGQLVERLAGAAEDAKAAGDRPRYYAAMTIRAHAQRRWQRRLDAWAVASYGEAVQP